MRAFSAFESPFSFDRCVASHRKLNASFFLLHISLVDYALLIIGDYVPNKN